MQNVVRDLQAVDAAWTREIRRTRAFVMTSIAGVCAAVVVLSVFVSWVFLFMLALIPGAMTGLDRSLFEIFGLLRRGLLPTRPGWMRIKLEKERILVTFRGKEFQIPASAIQAASWIFDDGWVGLRGVDNVFRLEIEGGTSFLVPESAEGYQELRGWLEGRLSLQRIPV